MTEEEFARRLAAIAERIPADVLADLRAAHDEYGWSCAAASEGQTCCLAWVRKALSPSRSS